MFKIFDWAGNELTKHGTFETFEDAWDYIFEHFEEEDHQELFVETSEVKLKQARANKSVSVWLGR